MPKKGDPIIASACDILLMKQHLADDETNGRKIAFLQAGLDVELLDAKARKNKYKLLREMYKRKKEKFDEEKKMMAEAKLNAKSASDRNSTVEFPIQSPPAINRSSSQQSESINVTININSLKTSKKDRKGYRLSSKQVISTKAREERTRRLKELAYREAVETLRHERVSKGKKAKSATEIATEVGNKYGVAISSRTLNKRIVDGRTALYAGRKGRRGNIPLGDYCALKAAFVTAVSLHQAGHEHEFTQEKWKSTLSQFLHNNVNGISAGKNLYDRLLRDTAIAFTAEKEYFVELRRQIWTNSLNIDTWFSGWKEALLELGFATDEAHVEEGKQLSEVSFNNGQKQRILNLDETNDDLGEDKETGGRPATTLVSRGVNRTGSNKSSSNAKKTTFIVAHNAAGEVAGIHIQFASDAKEIEDQGVKLEWLTGLPRGRGRFGFDEERDIPPTFGTNEKGGMDTQSFFEYLKKNIIPLYPDAEDVPSKRVIIKCDGGPGRLDWEMLVYLRRRGFYLFPTVPNATSVMQELDQSFGYFKLLTRKNQIALLAYLTENGRPVRIGRSNLNVILNGDENIPHTLKAFDLAFSKQKNLEAWSKVGAVPLTRECLKDPSVMRILQTEKEEDEQIWDVTCPNFQLKVEDICLANDLKTMAIINKQAVTYLNKQGWKGDVLLRKAPQISDKLKEVVKVTGKTSEQIIQDLGNSKRKYGAMFVQTGGMALNCDEAIKAGAFRIIQTEKKRRLDEHKEKSKAFKRQELAKKVLTKTSSSFNSEDLQKLIAWKMEGTGHSKFKSLKDRQTQWEKVKHKNIPLVNDPGPAPFDGALTHIPANVNESMKLLANEKTASQYWDIEVLPKVIAEVQELDDEDELKTEFSL